MGTTYLTYLRLVVQCLQDVTITIIIKEYFLNCASYYCDLQVHKHVVPDERVPRLQNWFDENKAHIPAMEWYEFSACSGSTFGIFCLVSYALT